MSIGTNQGVNVEEFFKIDCKELYNGLKTGHNVIFADGVIPMSPHEIIFNRYIWDIFADIDKTDSYKRYGGIPIVKAYSITEYYVNGFFTSKSLSNVLERIYKDLCIAYVEPDLDRMFLDDYLFRKIEVVYNEIYNDIACNGHEYQSSIDIMDFYEIQFQKPLIDAMKRVEEEKSVSSIENTYKVLDKVIRETPELKDNPIVRGYLSGAYNKGQVFQALASRGFVTEIDSEIIPTPVLSSFFLGMEDIAAMGAESRSAAKAAFVSTKAIEQSEYLARTLQLATMRIERLVDGDCGTTEYTDWYVNGADTSDIGKSELPYLVGSWYLNEETGLEEMITEDHTHLIGKFIKIRLPHNCKHPNSSCICLRCMGRLGYNIPYPTNIGHAVSVWITEKISQGILSIKHHSGSAQGIDFDLDPRVARFFRKEEMKSENKGPDKDKQEKGCSGLRLSFTPARNTKYELVIRQDYFTGIKGLTQGMDFDKIIASKLSRVGEFYIQVTDNKTGAIEYIDCDVSFSKSSAKSEKSKKKVSMSSKVFGHFTHEFISYILGNEAGEKNYYLDNEGQNYVINLNNWNKKATVIEFPTLEYNFLQMVKEVKGIVRNLEKTGDKERGDKNISQALQNMFNLFNVKIDVPLALISIVASAFVVRDKQTGDVRIARGKSDNVQSLQNVITGGSLGGIAPFERHNDRFKVPWTFDNNNKGYHPLDVGLMPQEVIEDHKKGLR